MKARLLILASLALAAAPVAAQGGGQGGMGAGRGAGAGRGMMSMALPSIDTLTTQLGLTAEQKPAVTKLIEKYNADTKDAQKMMADMMAGGAGGGMSEEARAQFTKMREARTAFNESLKKILTKDQAAKYDELYPARRGRGRQG